MAFSGYIIEESLTDKTIFNHITTLHTKIICVGEKENTPWVSQWTLHTVEIEEKKVDLVAKELSEAIDKEHASAWYADLKNGTDHYIIFSQKIFCIGPKQTDTYTQAKAYGESLGIPSHQLNFAS